jgi:uncharacterized protein YvpB
LYLIKLIGTIKKKYFFKLNVRKIKNISGDRLKEVLKILNTSQPLYKFDPALEGIINEIRVAFTYNNNASLTNNVHVPCEIMKFLFSFILFFL